VRRSGARHRIDRFIAPVVFALLPLVLAGCGASRELAGNRIPGHTLTIYSSLPLQGLSAAGARTVLDGEQLALAQSGGRVGDFGIVLKALDDATFQRAGWDPGQTTINAHAALQDPTTIGYIGDFDSGATAVAIPLLNRLGIPQISPTSTSVGLTSDGAAASPGEPAKYYPTGRRTFVRLPPDDSQEATVQVRLQRSLGCKRTVVLDDGKFDGYDAATAFQLAAHAGGLTLAGTLSFDPRAQDYRSLVLGVAQTGANCVLLSAAPESHAALLATQLAAALPGARIFATGALAQTSFTDPRRGGIPLALDPRVVVSAPAPGNQSASTAFTAAYGSQFGFAGPYAVYGYEAMKLLLSAIATATGGGRHTAARSQVLAALLASHMRSGPLGAFHVHSNGATTLNSYAIYLRNLP
jgi:branched-chain amino acid transport system substrate-binding protein